jgi:hypothetical protein
MSSSALEGVQVFEEALLKKYGNQIGELQSLFGWSVQACLRELQTFGGDAQRVAQHHLDRACFDFVVFTVLICLRVAFSHGPPSGR